jgi:hypothetical protein
MNANEIRKGSRIEYTYAAGKVVQGKIVKAAKVNGYDGWFVARLWDDAGEYGGCIHVDQIRVVSNAA